MFTRITHVFALLFLASAQPDLKSIYNSHLESRIADEYLVVLHEPNDDVDAVSYVDDVAVKLLRLSSEFTLINKFTALKSPILHVKTNNEEAMRAAYQLLEIQVIEANAANMKAQQDLSPCGVQLSTNVFWSIGRVCQRAPPNPSYYTATYTYQPGAGYGIQIYILDTGIYTDHNFFNGRATFGVNTIGGNDEDVHGHGTICAGLAMGDVSGVSRGATAVAVKVLDDEGLGTTSSVIAGINWVVSDLQSKGGRGVVSVSMAGDPSEAIDSAVASAVMANIPVVVPAGNTDTNACYSSPARSPSAITAAGITRVEELHISSNWGPCVDILAPGAGMQSTGPCHKCIASISGTSGSSAIVAGSVANYLTYSPTATPAQIKTNLIRDATEGLIDLRGTVGTPNLLLYDRCPYERSK